LERDTLEHCVSSLIRNHIRKALQDISHCIASTKASFISINISNHQSITTMASKTELANNLPSLKRFITTHDPKTKKAVFSDTLSEENKFDQIPGAAFGLGYVTKGFPVDLNADADVKVYKPYLESPPGLVATGGTVLRFVDVGPGHLSPMHRTVSLDYGVVIEGEVELVLDSGETRLLKRGDVAIQRGTMHAWRNVSDTEWARMMYVLQECKPVELDGEVLKEDYGSMKGVPSSS
jgi:quercetin dioxygenase-like cupin family protein